MSNYNTDKGKTAREIIAEGGPGAEKLEATLKKLVSAIMSRDERVQELFIKYAEAVVHNDTEAKETLTAYVREIPQKQSSPLTVQESL